MLLKIAIRNIMRHKRRTIFSSVTIAVGMLVFILMNSMMAGMDQGMIKNMLHLSTGAIRITTKLYEENMQTYSLQYGLEKADEIEFELLKDKRVSGVTQRTQFLGQLSNNSEAVPVAGTVINELKDSSVFDISKYIDGAYFSNQNDHEIILGSGLARDLGAKAGDYITLYSLTKYDSRNADEFLVAGILKSTDPTINKNGVFITYTAAEEFLDLDGLVTEIDIAVKDRMSFAAFMQDVKDVQNGLQTIHPDLSVKSFMEIGAAFFKISKSKEAFGIVFMIIILLIAGVGIFNTVFMSVYERIREIGVLRAHGMTPGEINVLFILEGIITGICGSILGITCGVIVNILLILKGLPMEKIMGNIDMGDIPLQGTIYGVWNFYALVFVLTFGVLVSTVASILPARVASKMQVTRALKFN